MTRAINESGKCIICKEYAYDICWNCDMFVCDEHKILVPYDEPTVEAKVFCPRCGK